MSSIRPWCRPSCRQCLRRHAAEDWGEVKRDVRITNWLTLRGEHGMPIVSKYRVGDRALQIATKADGSVTTIVLFAAGPPGIASGH